MTRENKLALIIGFGLVLVVGILVSDHFSSAHSQEAADLSGGLAPPTDERLGDPHLLTMVSADGPGESSDTSNARLSTDSSSAPLPLLENGGHALADRSREGVAELIDHRPPTYLRNPGPEELLRRDQERAAEAEEPPFELPRSYEFYTVKPGESLAKIAREHYGSAALWRKLAEFNQDRVPNPNVVRAGVTIRLPARDELLGVAAAPDAPAAQAPPQQKPPATERRFKTYTVKPGDILGKISLEQLGTSKRWREIYEANKDVIKDPNNVPAGIVIRIPQ